MTYDKQDLLLDLRRIRAGHIPSDGSPVDGDEEPYIATISALCRFIDDEHVTEAAEAI